MLSLLLVDVKAAGMKEEAVRRSDEDGVAESMAVAGEKGITLLPMLLSIIRKGDAGETD